MGPIGSAVPSARAASEREARISTSRPEPDGTVRFKAMLRAGDGASTYTLDGRLIDLMGKPRVDGELTARLPIAGLWPTPQRGNACACSARRPK